MAEVNTVIDYLLSRREAAQKLLLLRQDHSVADFVESHTLNHTLIAESAWNPESLFDMFLHGLSEEVKDELAHGSRLSHSLDHMDRLAATGT